MKIKSLLVAGLALVALNAMAEDKTCTSKLSFDTEIIKNAEIGVRVAYFPIVADLHDDAEDFTNVQFSFIMPEGLVGNNIRETAATVAYNPDEDEDLQALSWTAGMKEGNEYQCIAVNMKKTPVKVEQFNLCEVRMTKNAELAADAKIHVKDFKYTDYANNKYTAEEFDIDLGTVAVANLNAGKAVAGVKYYNVAGVAADEAFDGVNIVVTTYADGTQNVVKVVK